MALRQIGVRHFSWNVVCLCLPSIWFAWITDFDVAVGLRKIDKKR